MFDVTESNDFVKTLLGTRRRSPQIPTYPLSIP